MLLVLVFIIAGEGFSIHYKNLIRARLPRLAAKVTDSLYDISIQDIRINIFTRAVTVYGLRMKIDSSVWLRRMERNLPPNILLDVTVPEARITGVKWDDLSAEKSLSCNSVQFSKPEIRVQIMPEWITRPKTLYPPPPAISKVSALRIYIDEPALFVRSGFGEQSFSVQTDGGSIEAKDWVFYPHKAFDSSRFFGAKEASVTLTNASYKFPASLYRYDMKRITFNTATSDGSFNDLQIRPAMSYDSLYARVGHRQDVYDCYLPEVRINGLDWQKLISKHSLHTSAIYFSSPAFSIFYSKKPPSNTYLSRALYPQQWLQNLNFPLTIDKIGVSDGAVQYSETNNKTGETGAINFSYLEGAMYHVTNEQQEIEKIPFSRTLVRGKFMHRTEIGAVIDFSLTGSKGAFSINGLVRQLDAEQIRGPVNALAIADVKSLEIPRASVSIAGDEDSTWGRFDIKYHKLRLNLKKWDAEDSDVHSRIFLSFLANKLLLYPENPMPGEAFRIARTGVARGNTRSFFLMVWKNILQGCVKSAVRDDGAMDIVKHKAAQKGKTKQKFFKGLFPKRHHRHRQNRAGR